VTTLRRQALAPLLARDPDLKAVQTRAVRIDLVPAGAGEQLQEPSGIPGRPSNPILVPHTQLKPRSMGTIEGRAALIHALAHIELNAVEMV
jgi:uncharacterized ferritin-like protein (DUF455 family)